jgi:hypothetical protein
VTSTSNLPAVDRPPASHAAVPARRRPAVSTVLAVSLGAYAASRLVLLVAYVIWQRNGGGSLAGIWDGGWFVRIAGEGYPDGLRYPGDTKSAWAFLPLYPMLVAAVHAVGVPLTAAAVAVNVLLGAAVAAVLAPLATAVVGEAAASRAVVLFWFFPGSAALSLAYSEALFLLLVAVALLAVVRERWVLAGAATALAGATRAAALALMLAVLVAAVLAARRDRSPAPLVAPLLAPLGLLAFLVYGKVRTGDLLVWRHAQDDWDQSVDFGLRVPGSVRHEVFRHGGNGDTWVLTIVTGILVLAAVALLLARRPLPALPVSLWVYGVATAVVILSSTNVFTKPRFVLTVLPLFLLVGARLPERWHPVVVGTLAALLPLTGYLWLAGAHVIP